MSSARLLAENLRVQPRHPNWAVLATQQRQAGRTSIEIAGKALAGRIQGESMDKKQMIDNLNKDLAGELQAVIQYIQYSAMVTGVDRPQLSEFFRGEIPDELGHAQFLADKIVSLGGVPTTQPRPVPTAKDNHEMLQLVLRAEEQAIADYKERAQQAEEFGDVGLKVQLENQILDETTHREEVEKLLRG